MDDSDGIGAGGGAFIAVLFVALIGAIVFGTCHGWPQWNVYRAQLEGEAEFKRAEENRRIKVEEARAKLQAAEFEADAEIERARGVAEANTIIGDSLKGNEGYLRWLWIQGLHDGTSEIIYVPTEAGLPVLEAGRAVTATPTASP